MSDSQQQAERLAYPDVPMTAQDRAFAIAAALDAARADEAARWQAKIEALVELWGDPEVAPGGYTLVAQLRALLDGEL